MIRVKIVNETPVVTQVKQKNVLKPSVPQINGVLKGRDGYSPYVNERGTWMQYDDEKRQWVDSQVAAHGFDVSIDSIIQTDIDGQFNTVTFNDGNTLSIKNGQSGHDGHTPIKTVDYWTEQDKEQISSNAIRLIPTLTNLQIEELLS